MTKIARNGRPISENIYEVLSKLNEKPGFQEAFEKDLERYSRNEGYKSTFRLFMKYVTTGVNLPSDKDLGDQLKPQVSNFSDKRQDFYDRIVDYVGRECAPKKDWFADALKILNEVDALWNLGLKDHAEAYFMNIYKLYTSKVGYEEKYWHSYVLSKIAMYNRYFANQHSFIGKKDEHQKFTNRDEFVLISELEQAASRLDVNHAIYHDPAKWKQDSAEFRLFEVLALLAKQKHNYLESRAFVQEMERRLGDWMQGNVFRSYQGGKRIFDFHASSDPQEAHELHLAFTYYIKMERYHLCIQDGHLDEAESVLQSLYDLLNKTFELSRNYMTGLVLYLKLDLQQSQFALALAGKKADPQIAEFKGHFLATKAEVANLEARLEVNQLLLNFLSPERPDLKEYEKYFKVLDGKLKGVHEIKVELELLKLFMCIENYLPEKIDTYIRQVTNSANDAKRNTELLKTFLLKAKKAEFSNFGSRSKDAGELVTELEAKRNPKNHLDNMVIFWLTQFVSRSKKVD